ncbi:MAG: M1 family aminopeptidase, partial [Kangiellaceae bacterium]|nr:M1 family aminopeptidase [Kangiellaceae bacterium]
DVYAEVEFYPSERRVAVKGHYLIENKNDKPLVKFLMFWSGGKNRSFDYSLPNSTEVDRDDKFYTTWVKFDKPLQPGETSRLDFTYERANRGFVDRGADTRVVENGSFVNNSEIFPHFGYNGGLQLADRHERRKRGLPAPERLPKLEDESQYGTNFIGKEADFINFETIVSTSEEQFAISPGYLQKQWKENGRSYYHYKMDAPIFNFVAFLSGEYQRTAEEYKGIPIEVYHHPEHTMNVDRMILSVKDSLDYFGQQFSPYQHRQVRIIEFPRYARFAQSFSNTIPYSEDIGFIADLRDQDVIDYVYFVTAHEMAHQWWGHQITPANVQGSAVLSETLSEYSAYMVMEKKLGKDQLRQFLKYEMDRYLRGRSGEVIEEMPLYRAENQQYIHYQKGGVVMYALRDIVGEAPVNRALKKLVEEFGFKADPYPTTLDLLRHLKTEISSEHHDLIDDLFKRITIFDLKVTDATAKKISDGEYQLDVTVEARKFYADGQGQEQEVELDFAFDIGAFSKNPDDAKGSDHVIHMQKYKIKKGENTFSIKLDRLPLYVGIDPYIKMIDRNSNDNLKRVTIN